MHEQTLYLSQVTGMLKRIAAAMVAQHGKYTCTIAGKKTLVLPDPS